jgi:hypothetical protein
VDEDAIPRLLLGAAALTASGVSCLLIGSAALRAHGVPIDVHDTDVVIEPGERNLRRLHAALAVIATRPRSVPPAWRMSSIEIATVRTSYGKIDCMLERGRLDWPRLRASAALIWVADVSVLVAAEHHARDLRRRFKE